MTKNTTLVSIRTLSLILETIKNNADLDYKSLNLNKSKGAEGKCKRESIDSRIPKKPKKVGWTDKHCVLWKTHGGLFKSHNTRECHCFNKDGTLIRNRGGESRPQPIKKGSEGGNFVQLMQTEIKKAIRNICTRTRNAMHKNWTVIAAPMTVPEGAGQVALGNHIYVRNVN